MRAQHGPKRSLVTDALMALAGLLVSGPVVGCGSGQQTQQPSAAPTTVAVPASTSAPASSDGTTMVEPGVDEPPAPPVAPPAATDTDEPVGPPPRQIQVKYGGPSGR